MAETEAFLLAHASCVTHLLTKRGGEKERKREREREREREKSKKIGEHSSSWISQRKFIFMIS